MGTAYMSTDNIESLTGGSKEGFVSHVFNFNEESKMEMMNIVQYTLVGVLPIILLNKTMQKYVPEADDDKGSTELLAEVAVQLIVMFVGLLLTHRMVTFVPTYSTVKYEKVSIIQIVLAVLMITLSLQTKLGEKVGILFDRITEMIMGKSREGMTDKENNDAAKTTGRDAMRSAPGAGADGFTLPQQPGGMTSISSIQPEGMQSLRQNPNQPQQQGGGYGGLLDGGIEAFAGF